MNQPLLPGRISALLAGICLAASVALSQSSERYVGTIVSVKTTPAEIEVRGDSGSNQLVRVIPETVFQQVDPGAKDLKNARPAVIGDASVGDRVLVALQPGTQDLLRLVIMPAANIAKRDDGQREDWRKRGIGGVVTTVGGGEITVQLRSTMPGTAGGSIAIEIGENTVLRRYAPDSVRFADAVPATIRDVSPGDQLRARGEKDQAGTHISAEEVVFGSFVTKFGEVTAVDPSNRQLTITDATSHQPLTIRLADGSQIKRMPGMPFGGPGSPAGPGPGGPAGLGPGQPPAGMPSGGMRPPDMSQMLESLPASTLDAIHPGETIVVSATKSTAADHVTAITLLANAEMLIRMATMSSGGNGRGAPMGGPGNGMPGGMSGIPGGLSLEGMQIPGILQ